MITFLLGCIVGSGICVLVTTLTFIFMKDSE